MRQVTPVMLSAVAQTDSRRVTQVRTAMAGRAANRILAPLASSNAADATMLGALRSETLRARIR